MEDQPILICYDDSESSRHAIKVAAAVLGPRRAVVLDVGPELTASESVALTSSALPGAAFEELNRAGALEKARAGAVRAREAGFDAEPSAEVAAPTWEAIVDRADELDALVIVMGTRGLKGAKEVLEGSVSHQVAQHSGRPVLIVPPREHD